MVIELWRGLSGLMKILKKFQNSEVIIPRYYLALFLVLIVSTQGVSPEGSADTLIRSLSEAQSLSLRSLHQGILRNLIQTNLARYCTHRTLSNYLAGKALGVKTVLHPGTVDEEGLELSLILLPSKNLSIEENTVFEILDGVLTELQNTLGYFGLRFDQAALRGRLLVQGEQRPKPEIFSLPDWISRLNAKKQTIAIAAELVRIAAIESEIKQGKRSPDPEQSKAHLGTLKRVINAIGWPSASKVGARASHASWLLALQADFDREFQIKALELLQSDKDTEPSEIAYLVDRIRVLEGERQLYGTQYQVDPKGNIVPLPIEKFEEVDERRKEAGLGPFEEYLEVLYEAQGKKGLSSGTTARETGEANIKVEPGK
jgi:hypothetical protein